MRAVRPKPSPAVLVSGLTAGLSEVSRFSCMKLPGVSGVFDYAGPSRDSRYRTCSCCLPPVRKRRRPDCLFSELNTQPTCTPVYASPCTSRYTAQNSGPSGSLLLSRRNLSFPASCRFIPAHLTGPTHSLTNSGRIVGNTDVSTRLPETSVLAVIHLELWGVNIAELLMNNCNSDRRVGQNVLG
jgi:hypothetical protein